MRLHLDYETASDLNLKQVGGYRYAAHPSTRILMLGWAFNDDEPRLWEPHKNPAPPAELIEGMRDPCVRKHAYNATFERLITRNCLKIEVPCDQWRCTMVEAFYLSFAGRLGTVLEAIGLSNKDKRGDQLITLFCSPAPKNHHADWYDWVNRPGEWEEFRQYCFQDVRVERELWHFLQKFPTMHEWDWKQYFLDQSINDRGVLLDVGMAERAIEMWDKEKILLTEKLKDITGLPKVTRAPFIEYFEEEFGIELETTRKDDLALLARQDSTPPEAKEVISLWAQKEAKAVSKYTAITRVAGEDHRARGMFQYKGAARTDRVGGRLIQLQNLKRPYSDNPTQILTAVNTVRSGSPDVARLLYPDMSVSDVLGGAVRHALQPAPGKVFAVADLTSIESVVLGWLCMCDAIDQTFRNGRDSYKVFATEYYGIPYEEVTKAQRGFSKPPVLGCGYMLGWRGLIAYAEGYGVDMSEKDAKRAVDTFREMYPEIVEFWGWVYDAVKYVTKTWQPLEGYRMVIERDADFLRIRLPSGRNLSYYKPDVAWMPAPWDKKQSIENFVYMGMDLKNRWTQISCHAGGVTENIVQSLAGDILWGGITRASNAGLCVVVHVHDEIGVEVDRRHGEDALRTLIRCLVTQDHWNKDMWLGADGELTDFYTK